MIDPNEDLDAGDLRKRIAYLRERVTKYHDAGDYTLDEYFQAMIGSCERAIEELERGGGCFSEEPITQQKR